MSDTTTKPTTGKPKKPPMQVIQVRPALLDRTAAAAFLSISESMLYELVLHGGAPKPRKISNHRVGWLTDELADYSRDLPVSDLLPPKNSGVGRAGNPAPQ